MTLHVSNDPTQDAISTALRCLEQSTFAPFATGVTPDEACELNSVCVTSDAQYDNFAELERLTTMAESALAEQGQPESLASRIFIQTICRLANSTIKAFNCETAWVCLRSFVPEENFTPRWHRDGRFFDTPPIQQKAVFALRGRLSLLATINSDVTTEFDDYERALSRAYRSNNRSEILTLQERLNNLVLPSDVVRLNAPYEGALFNVGDIGERAAVHSEPEFDSARWFMSVVPGSNTQIMDLKSRWKS